MCSTLFTLTVTLFSKDNTLVCNFYLYNTRSVTLTLGGKSAEKWVLGQISFAFVFASFWNPLSLWHKNGSWMFRPSPRSEDCVRQTLRPPKPGKGAFLWKPQMSLTLTFSTYLENVRMLFWQKNALQTPPSWYVWAIFVLRKGEQILDNNAELNYILSMPDILYMTILTSIVFVIVYYAMYIVFF